MYRISSWESLDGKICYAPKPLFDALEPESIFGCKIGRMYSDPLRTLGYLQRGGWRKKVEAKVPRKDARGTAPHTARLRQDENISKKNTIES